MPFTLSHPAAAVPLLRPLRRFGVLSALVIGSATPDLEYVLPFHLARHETHSPSALFWFCLPAGLLGYVLFHVLLKGPLLGLLPQSVLSRLGPFAARYRSLPEARWSAVVVSLLCGAVTHLAWDAFTHGRGAAVEALPALQTELFQFGAYPVCVYTLLQHASTVIGLVLLASWSRRWLNAAPENGTPLPVTLTSRQRAWTLAAIIAVPVAVGLSAGWTAFGLARGMVALQVLAGTAVFSAIPVFALAVSTYSVAWHVWAARAGGAPVTSS